MSKAILERELLETERKHQALKDLGKLYEEGFEIDNISTFAPSNTSASKSVMEKKLRKMARERKDKNKLLKDVRIKRVQHPNRNIKTYILVKKKR